MKRVALLGGSFNPTHTGHFEGARYIHEHLHVDEIWFLFSYNTDKNKDGYAPLHHRMRMAEMLARHFPNTPITLSNIQDEIGTHITAEVLRILHDKFPQHHFIWVMGADSMTGIHTWEEYAYIFENFQIAVMRRGRYVEKAFASKAATEFAHLRHFQEACFVQADTGWIMLDNPLIDLSSTALRAATINGKAEFSGVMQEIGTYIKDHKLFETEI